LIVILDFDIFGPQVKSFFRMRNDMKRIMVFAICGLVFMTGSMNAQFADSDITVKKDIVYATVDGFELTLDAAYPKEMSGNAPAIVHIHGGGWQKGQKSARYAIQFARNGFVGFSINYRLSGTALFPAGVHDCKTAIRWVRANAKKYNVDPNRIGIVGSSAGGHLVSLLGTSGGDDYLEGDGPHQEFSSRVQSVVNHFGPMDLAHINDSPSNDVWRQEKWLGKSIAEASDEIRRANPMTFIDAQDPPTLTIHGELDTLVTINNGEVFYEALQKAGVETEIVRVKNAGHGYRPIPKNATVTPGKQEIDALAMGWFEKTLGKPDYTRWYKKRSPQGKIHVLFVGGGEWHDTLVNAGYVRWRLESTGDYYVTYTEDYSVFTRLDAYDAIIMNHMAIEITDEEEQGLLDAVRAGKPLVALHATTAAFIQPGKERPRFHHMLGGNRPVHPPRHSFRVDVVDVVHPIIKDISAFKVYGELFKHKHMEPDVQVLLTADYEEQTHPLAWTRQFGDGKIFYLALGHGMESTSHESFLRLVQQGLRWTMGR
jgi:acetyl esterase/lipase/type 1 glutamine amidotransferase